MAEAAVEKRSDLRPWFIAAVVSSCALGVFAGVTWLFTSPSLYCATTGYAGIGYRPYDSRLTIAGTVSAGLAVVLLVGAIGMWCAMPTDDEYRPRPAFAVVLPALIIAGIAAILHWDLASACL